MTATSLAARPCPAIIGRRAHTGSNASCSAKRAARPRCRRASLRVRAADDPDPEPVPTDEGCRTIVITSGKGGVGKTTTSANLGMSIARLGYKVCLVDADIGLRNLDLLLGLENRVMYTAMEVLEGVPHGAGAHPRQAVAIARAPPNLQESPEVQRHQGFDVPAHRHPQGHELPVHLHRLPRGHRRRLHQRHRRRQRGRHRHHAGDHRHPRRRSRRRAPRG